MRKYKYYLTHNGIVYHLKSNENKYTYYAYYPKIGAYEVSLLRIYTEYIKRIYEKSV